MTPTLRKILILMWVGVGVIALIMAFLMLTRGASAASLCGKRADFIRALANRYQESQRAMGISGNTLVDIFSAGPGGTWTILRTTTDGITCIIATGSDWGEALKPKIIAEEKNL